MRKVEIVLPVHFFSAGQFVAPKRWVHQRRRLDSSVLMLLREGHLVIWEDDQRMEVNAGDMLILQAGHTHIGEQVSADEPLVYYWAHFLSNDSGAHSDDNLIFVDQYGPPNDYDMATVFFHQLINESRTRPENTLSCDYLMSMILIRLVEHGQEKNSMVLHAQIREYLRLNYRRNITLKHLASVFPYSKDYMSKVFKKNEGIAIHEYLHELRLAKAKRCLLTTLDTVQDIANYCGYSNDKFFIKKFLNHEGKTPTQYRNLFVELHQNDE